MEMNGEYRIAAPRETVWQALNDPDVLRQCIPGCDELEKLSDTTFTAKVTAKVGPVKARFAGKVTLSDLDPPTGYRISGEGSGGAAGFAKGGADVRLREEEDGRQTVLHYQVRAQIGGKLAQIGSRLIDGTARKMADDFFGCFAAHVGPSSVKENAGALEPEIAAAAIPDEGVRADVASEVLRSIARPAADAHPPATPTAAIRPIFYIGAWVSAAIVVVLLIGFLS